MPFRMQKIYNNNYSDDEDFGPVAAYKVTNEKLKQKFDTNVFQVSMACLKDSTYEIATGDIIECKECKGVLNMFSQVTIESSGGS
jgi:hypothetical protein